MTETSNKRPTEEQIARRAYEIYAARGNNNRRDIDDWLAAEKELTAQSSPSSETSRTTAPIHGGSALVAEANSKHDSAAQQGQDNPPRKFVSTRAS